MHRAITKQPASITLTTLYRNSYVSFGSHKVTYVIDDSTGTAAPKNWGYYPKSRGKEPLPMLYTVAYIMDEQGNQVTFKTRDIPVKGGGVIQVINAVSELCNSRRWLSTGRILDLRNMVTSFTASRQIGCIQCLGTHASQ